ncbi:MAG: TIGR04282 family arsenosugar biosynthesis glycosyltransferase [Crocinitomicaceae bacterium]|nr:TIGR04282 family arsenosugar biosynthesis glycosyltransferase [Crocinitomicaceae bacterium]
MSEDLIIVFTKNLIPGKVKTRLAASIGDDGAFEVYKELLDITEKVTGKIDNADLHIYYSDQIDEYHWKDKPKFVQKGSDLGERMQQAFEHSFSMGYRRVIGIGSDLPDINTRILIQALESLHDKKTVFGKAKDGGYYLLGMVNLYDCIFIDKSWSTDQLLKQTLDELIVKDISFDILAELSDIDTLEDLKGSTISTKFKHLYELP